MAKNNRTIAAKVARQTWGPEIQRMIQIAPGMWDISTASHGGIVCDTDIYPAAKKWSVPVLIRSNSCMGYTSEQHFAAFEEDCDWAIIHYLYGDSINYKRIYKMYSTQKSYEEWLDWYKGCITNCIKDWHQKIIEELDSLKEEIAA